MDKPASKLVFSRVKTRHFCALVFSLITAVLMIPGMATYLPFATADKIGVPIFLFPFIWVGLFIYSYMAKKTWQVLLVLSVLSISHFALSAFALM